MIWFLLLVGLIALVWKYVLVGMAVVVWFCIWAHNYVPPPQPSRELDLREFYPPKNWREDWPDG